MDVNTAQPLPHKLLVNPYLVRLPTAEELPWSDGEPLESQHHALQLPLISSPLEDHWKDRNDFCVNTNMFVYFSPSQEKTHCFRGPDAFVALGVPKRPRKSYVMWEENNIPPSVIIEILSPSTIEEDKFTKKVIYQDILKVPEYYWHDLFSDDFAGFRLQNGVYQPIQPDAKGMFHSIATGLILRRWQGVYDGVEGNWLRWATPDGIVLPTGFEIAEVEKSRANLETRRATAEKARADYERLRADGANAREEEQKARADEERKRADEAKAREMEERRRADEAKAREEEQKARAEKLAALLKSYGIDPGV